MKSLNFSFSWGMGIGGMGVWGRLGGPDVTCMRKKGTRIFMDYTDERGFCLGGGM